MQKFMFTIVDKVSSKAGNIFTADTIGEAERQFHDAIKYADPKSLFASHPQDFSLFLLGEFDDKALEISNLQTTVITTGKPLTSEVSA